MKEKVSKVGLIILVILVCTLNFTLLPSKSNSKDLNLSALTVSCTSTTDCETGYSTLGTTNPPQCCKVYTTHTGHKQAYW